eukprot:7983851-Lingulodinium_polyedra.AAC.1
MEKEWGSWLRFQCVRVLSPADSEAVRQTVSRKRIPRSDMRRKDKNANLRTEQNQLGVAAKAPLCVQD